MDFPLNLNSNPTWVYGREELKQNVIMLLKNHVGTWLQSPSIGACFDIHMQDNILVEEGVRQTLEQVPYINIVSITVDLPNIKVVFVYNGETINFQYEMNV